MTDAVSQMIGVIDEVKKKRERRADDIGHLIASLIALVLGAIAIYYGYGTTTTKFEFFAFLFIFLKLNTISSELHRVKGLF